MIAMNVAKGHRNGNGADTQAQGCAVLIGIGEHHASSGADHLTGSIHPQKIQAENLTPNLSAKNLRALVVSLAIVDLCLAAIASRGRQLRERKDSLS
jgi:D-Tyr-tRNAtyr deacylase